MQWSYSRRDVLERCPRWYYYQYYGANSRTAKPEPEKETLRFLNRLSNRYLRTGGIAHLVIGTYLKRLQQGEEWSPRRVLGWAQSIYRGDLEHSRQFQPRDPPPKGRYPPTLLLEFYYGFRDAEELWMESEGRLLTVLRNFVTSPGLARFRAGGRRADALVEKSITLKEEHFSLRGKIDLAYPDRSRVVVVDWKIGSANGGEDSLQLLSYALGAMQEFGCASGDVELYRVYLGDSSVSAYAASERAILRAKAHIIQDLERMRTLEDYGRNAVAEAFTPCGQTRVCVLCPFQRICPKG